MEVCDDKAYFKISAGICFGNALCGRNSFCLRKGRPKEEAYGLLRQPMMRRLTRVKAFTIFA